MSWQRGRDLPCSDSPSTRTLEVAPPAELTPTNMAMLEPVPTILGYDHQLRMKTELVTLFFGNREKFRLGY